MTPQELQRWRTDYMFRLDLKVKRELFMEGLERFKTDMAGLRRKREEHSFESLQCVESACRAAARGEAIPMSLALRWQAAVREEAGFTPDDEVRLLPMWRAHAEEIAKTHGLTVTWAPIVAGINAYAFMKAKRIECAPITSSYSYATFLHEAGHCINPCQPSHKRVVTDAKFKESLCVADELTAWRWAMSAARPTWTEGMHRSLSTSLPSYRRHGTTSEQREIDGLSSGLGMRTAQLARMRRSA